MKIEWFQAKQLAEAQGFLGKTEEKRAQNHDAVPSFDKRDPAVKPYLEFESLFVKHMLSAMHKTIPQNSPQGAFQEVFQDLLYNEYALSLSQNHDLGLARALFKQHLHGK